MCVHMQGHITIFNMVFHISLIEEGTSEQRLEGSERVREMPRHLSEDRSRQRNNQGKGLKVSKDCRGRRAAKGE